MAPSIALATEGFSGLQPGKIRPARQKLPFVEIAGPLTAFHRLMYYVYCIISEADPRHMYKGFTENLRQRVVDHNNGCNRSTAPFKPWKLKGYFAFDENDRALAFECYLKSGSGHAFAKRHLW